MSAVRSSLIDAAGKIASQAGAVGTGWTLPAAWWPADDVGRLDIWPDAATAGRQIYRAVYTAVSAVTLGNACWHYWALRSLSNTHFDNTALVSPTLEVTCLVVTSLALGTSLASLVNPSPLSLMPGFTTTKNNTTTGSSSTRLPLQRQDSLKLSARGLTRITRHPLILPVVPWGVAHAILLGPTAADGILWGGLSVYSAVGCAAQDLRVTRQEGSVGTVFGLDGSSSISSSPATTTGGTSSSSSSTNVEPSTQTALQDFYASTSYLPFAAMVDGRQSWAVTWQEFPTLAWLLGCVVGYGLEQAFLDLILSATDG